MTSEIIKVSVSVIRLNLRLRLITLTSTLILTVIHELNFMAWYLQSVLKLIKTFLKLMRTGLLKDKYEQRTLTGRRLIPSNKNTSFFYYKNVSKLPSKVSFKPSRPCLSWGWW